MDNDALHELFLPHLNYAAAGVRAGKRLVHYTSAEAAYKIIKGSEVWLRSVHLMNDYSEMTHGLSCLQAAWQSPSGIELGEWLEDCFPGLKEELQQTFDGHAEGLLQHTYIMSLSEHDDDEDELGRLSMWRAYGGRNGVAMVLNTDAFLAETNELAVFSTPVIYQSVEDYVAWFAGWVRRLAHSQKVIDTLNKETMLGMLFHIFRVTVLATKHPGFREEKEWRLFHSPTLDGHSDWIRLETEVIGGVPQPLIKLSLRDDEEKSIRGVAPATLLNRLIIGPCENPLPIKQALTQVLKDAYVEDAFGKIWASEIPLRQ